MSNTGAVLVRSTAIGGAGDAAAGIGSSSAVWIPHDGLATALGPSPHPHAHGARRIDALSSRAGVAELL